MLWSGLKSGGSVINRRRGFGSVILDTDPDPIPDPDLYYLSKIRRNKSSIF
jgi:hypothetical protein